MTLIASPCKAYSPYTYLMSNMAQFISTKMSLIKSYFLQITVIFQICLLHFIDPKNTEVKLIYLYVK